MRDRRLLGQGAHELGMTVGRPAVALAAIFLVRVPNNSAKSQCVVARDECSRAQDLRITICFR